MKLGIIGAMDVEIQTLLTDMEVQTQRKHAGGIYYEGVLAGLPAVVVQCGVGKVNASIAAQVLCDCYDVTHLVNTGIAGSLNARLDIGDLVISTDVMYHDFDCSIFDYAPCQVPGMDVTAFPADAELAKLALDAAESVTGGHCCMGRIASGDQFISSSAQKEKIIRVTHADCTEMEGAAIAHTAYRNRIPFVVLRAISDKADDTANSDYPTFERQAAHDCAAVTHILAERLAQQP